MTGTSWGLPGRPAPEGPPRPSHDVGPPAHLIGWFSLLGGLIGMVNLGVDHVLRPGGWTLLYVVVMGGLVLLGAGLLALRTLAPALLPLVVLSGHLVYVTVVLCVVDATKYATPVMLLFGMVAGAVVLGPRALAANCALLVPVLVVTLSPRYPDEPVGLVVQVAVHTAILVITALAIFWLRRRAEQLLARTWELSRTDDLTGLPNRRSLTEQAPALVARARRSGQMLAVIVLDVDRFKQVNDEHGHTVGDQVLRAVGTALQAVVRADEVVARTGGEEVVVVACVPDVAEATRMAARLQEAVRASSGPVAVTCSLGLAVASPPADAEPTAWLWHRVGVADGAMYRAKREGRDRVVVDGDHADVALDGAS